MIEIKTLYKKSINGELCNKLAALLEEGFPEDSARLWLLRFNLWWFSNPALDENTPIAWILIDENNAISGFRGNIPVYYTYADKRLKGSASTSWYIKSEIRGDIRSQMFYKQLEQTDVDLFIATTPILPVKRRLLGVGFKEIKARRPIRNYVIITNFGLQCHQLSAVLSGTLSRKRGIARILLTFVVKMLHNCPVLHPRKSIKNSKDEMLSKYNIKECDDVDVFMKYFYGDKIIHSISISRDKSNLEWLFFSDSVKALLERTVNLVHDDSGEVSGYFVYDIQESKSIKSLRIREINLKKYNRETINRILKYSKYVAKANACAKIYITATISDDRLSAYFDKKILLKIGVDNLGCILFRDGCVNGIDPYVAFTPSDFDPDKGVI